MAALNSEALKNPTAPVSSITPGDERTIVFAEGCGIEGRKPGVPYVVDSALARHYAATGKAEIVEEGTQKPKEKEPDPEAGEPADRAMQAPPRGKRK